MQLNVGFSSASVYDWLSIQDVQIPKVFFESLFYLYYTVC